MTVSMNPRVRRASFGPGTEGLSVDQLVREIGEGAVCIGSGESIVTGVQQDSRRVAPGDVFVVRKGETSDGAQFVADALKKGASAILAEEGVVDASTVPGGGVGGNSTSNSTSR